MLTRYFAGSQTGTVLVTRGYADLAAFNAVARRPSRRSICSPIAGDHGRGCEENPRGGSFSAALLWRICPRVSGPQARVQLPDSRPMSEMRR